MVNVVTDGLNSKRVEDSCVDVATHFEEYVYMYQRSTSFDVGVQSDDFSLGLSYHKDVEQVYKSITATGQAVGAKLYDLVCFVNTIKTTCLQEYLRLGGVCMKWQHLQPFS